MDRTSIESYFNKAAVMSNVFNALCAHPYGLTVRQLVEQAYTVTNEPDWAASSITVMICHFNKLARRHGWRLYIRGNGGPGSKYQIYIGNQKPYRGANS
jgi:hypothetical protein